MWRQKGLPGQQEGGGGGTSVLAGRLLATGGYDGKVKLFNSQSGLCFVTFAEHTAPISAICFTPQGNAILSASEDGSVRAFDLLRYRNFRTFASPDGLCQFSSVAVDSGGEIVAASSKGGKYAIYVWSIQTGNVLEVLAAHTSHVQSIHFSPSPSNPGQLVSASWDSTLRVWDLYGKARAEPLDCPSSVLCVVFDPRANDVCAAACLTGQVLFWNVSNGTNIGSIEGLRDIQSGRQWGQQYASSHTRGAKLGKGLKAGRGNRAVAPKAKAGAKASAETEPKQSAAAAEAPWVHGGGKPRRVRFREAEVVEIREDDEADKLAAALRLLEERGVQLDEEAQKKLGVGRQADPSKAGPEAPKSHHATVQSAMWKVKNTAGKLERSQQNLEAAQEALADAQLAVDKATEAKEAAAKAHAQAQDQLERARRVEQAGLPPEAQLDQRAQDVDRLAQATLGARYAAELKDHFEGEEAVQVTQAIELFSKLAAASKARIEAAKRAAEVERFLESHGCSLPKRLRRPAGSAAGKGAAEAAEKSEGQKVSRLDAALSPHYPVQLTLDGKKEPERALRHRAPRPFPTERPEGQRREPPCWTGLLSELADAIAAVAPGSAAGNQGPSEDGPEPAREADDAAPGGAPENVEAAMLDESFDQGGGERRDPGGPVPSGAAPQDPSPGTGSWGQPAINCPARVASSDGHGTLPSGLGPPVLLPPSASAEALRGVRACYDEDWTEVVHSLKGDVLDLPPCAATESETEPAGQVSGAGQRHSGEEAVECVAKVERLGPAAGLEAPRATGSWPRTLDELYASFAALMEEDLGGLVDMKQEDLMKCAGRGESARIQEGTISASRRGTRARGSPQARTWHMIAALLWERLASRRRLRAPHLVSRELDVLARLQAKIVKLAAQDLVGDIGLKFLSPLDDRGQFIDAPGAARHGLFAWPAIACWARDMGSQEIADAGRRAPQDDLGLVRGFVHLGLDQAPPPGMDERCRRAGSARHGFLEGVICIDGSAMYPEEQLSELSRRLDAATVQAVAWCGHQTGGCIVFCRTCGAHGSRQAKFLADPCVPLASKGRDAARLARRALECLSAGSGERSYWCRPRAASPPLPPTGAAGGLCASRSSPHVVLYDTTSYTLAARLTLTSNQSLRMAAEVLLGMACFGLLAVFGSREGLTPDSYWRQAWKAHATGPAEVCQRLCQRLRASSALAELVQGHLLLPHSLTQSSFGASVLGGGRCTAIPELRQRLGHPHGARLASADELLGGALVLARRLKGKPCSAESSSSIISFITSTFVPKIFLRVSGIARGGASDSAFLGDTLATRMPRCIATNFISRGAVGQARQHQAQRGAEPGQLLAAVAADLPEGLEEMEGRAALRTCVLRTALGSCPIRAARPPPGTRIHPSRLSGDAEGAATRAASVPLQTLDVSDSDEENEAVSRQQARIRQATSLPGVDVGEAKDAYSEAPPPLSASNTPAQRELHVWGVAFSADSQTFAAATSHGVFVQMAVPRRPVGPPRAARIYAADMGCSTPGAAASIYGGDVGRFVPQMLTKAVSAPAVVKALDAGDLCRAMILALALNDYGLLRRVYEAVPTREIPVIIASVGAPLLPALLWFLSLELRPSSGTAHFQFHLKWVASVIDLHLLTLLEMSSGRSTSRTGSALEAAAASKSDVAAMCLQLLVELSQRYGAMSKTFDSNIYMLRYLSNSPAGQAPGDEEEPADAEAAGVAAPPPPRPSLFEQLMNDKKEALAAGAGARAAPLEGAASGATRKKKRKNAGAGAEAAAAEACTPAGPAGKRPRRPGKRAAAAGGGGLPG
ncbi:unnamed protein product [Prorocentrum cordatum]|uniref:Uncharacterized protein n=1 Tax=Prorocentrum cordatum TaxID=2364126 RepID=A0ABN9T785_9DINO|nr:unnamed protein product [Polarella glacialis]